MKEVNINPLKELGHIHPVWKVAQNMQVTVDKILELAGRGKFSLYIDVPENFDIYIAEISSKGFDQKRRFEKIKNIEFLKLSKTNCNALLQPVYEVNRASEAIFSQALIQSSSKTYATSHKMLSHEKEFIDLIGERLIPEEEYHFALYTAPDMNNTMRYPAPREIPDGMETSFGRENLYISDVDIAYLKDAIEINRQELRQEQQASDEHFGKTTEFYSHIASETSLIDSDLNFTNCAQLQTGNNLDHVPDLTHITSIEQFKFHQNTPKSFKALMHLSERIGKALANNSFNDKFLNKQIEIHFPESSNKRFTVLKSIVLPEFLRKNAAENQKKDLSHITPELKAAFEVSEICWKNVGVGDESKYPTKIAVIEELQRHGISANKSDVLEDLIRAAQRTTGRPKTGSQKKN